MSSILKTNALIKSITRRAFIPSSQETFTDEDFLEMATEEVNLGLVPLIQRMHEEHLVYFVDLPISDNIKNYPIPSRAHGNKLRDVALVDENGNIFEMHRYSLSEISDFSNVTSYVNNRGFYLQNNEVILSNFEPRVGESLRMYFYMRPNMLVTEDRGVEVTQISTVFETDQITQRSGSATSILLSSDEISGVIINTFTSSNVNLVLDKININEHGFSTNAKIVLSDSILNLANGTYFVIRIDKDNFKLSSTLGGPALDLISAGVGTSALTYIPVQKVVVTSPNHGLPNNSYLSILNSNSVPSIDGTHKVSIVDRDRFSINVEFLSPGTTAAWTKVIECSRFSISDTPKHFSNTDHFDFVQHVSPNKILKYEVPVNIYDQNNKTISFPIELVSGVSLGDYITAAEETIVPNIPTELHPILAQRVAIACLEAMGDEQNKQSAERKLAGMEKDAGTFLDNRVDGASQKIKSRHSPLVNTLDTYGRRNRRW